MSEKPEPGSGAGRPASEGGALGTVAAERGAVAATVAAERGTIAERRAVAATVAVAERRTIAEGAIAERTRLAIEAKLGRDGDLAVAGLVIGLGAKAAVALEVVVLAVAFAEDADRAVDATLVALSRVRCVPPWQWTRAEWAGTFAWQ